MTDTNSSQPTADPHRRLIRERMRLGVLLTALWTLACGVEARDYSPEVPPELRGAAAGGMTEEEKLAQLADAEAYDWPAPGDQVVILDMGKYGEIEIALYPSLAPKAVENFLKLAEQGFYDGTTFHRVVPKFMIQGGDPNSRDDDPSNDGHGGPGYTIEDEFNDAPHLRGVVAMAHSGFPNTGGSQFFIVSRDSLYLDGRYTAFGRVVRGMKAVDKIAKVKRDKHGRWGSQNRPLQDVVIGGAAVAPGSMEMLGVAVGPVGDRG